MTTKSARVGTVVLLVAVVSRGWAEKQACTINEHGQEICSNSLLQSRAKKAYHQVELQEESPVAWAAAPYEDCIPDCGSKKFRDVFCFGVYDAKKVEQGCTGPKPASFLDCVCGGSEVCADKPAKGCGKEDAGSGDTDTGGYVEVGCFEFPEPDGEDDIHDMTCMTFTSTESEKLCKAGLPFYAYEKPDMDADTCSTFCLSKGMDIFGLAGGGRLCRCGATALNKEVWHEETPRDGLAFDPSLGNKATSGCPLKIFRYNGHYEDDGVPSKYWNIKEDDLEYVDSVVTGHEVGENVEEDGTPEAEGENLLQKEGATEDSLTPGFDRPCWPGNCGPGRGPWRDRVTQPPPGTQHVWEEYVTIKYAFESNVDSGRKTSFRAAVDEWKNKTCINLIEQASQPSGPHIMVGIYDTGSCYLSGMGHGTSRINLGWCNSMRSLGSMIHEIGHAIGMNHEQKRPDATQNYHGHGPFLQMFWDQIPSRWLPQYLPASSSYTGSAVDGPNDPHSGWSEYDFGSIMHYSGGNRYDTIPANKESLVGNRKHLTAGDIEQINDMYQCLPRCTPTYCPTRPPTPAPTPVPHTPAPTPIPPISPIGSCSFETDPSPLPFCGMWYNAQDDHFDWSRNLGRTPSGNTGPSGASDGTYYMFIETSSPRKSGDKAILKSLPLLLLPNMKLTFDYHMYGGNIGTLKVKVGGSKVFTRKGDQGNEWHRKTIDLSSATSPSEISFEGIRGSSWAGDIAIDNVIVQQD